MGFERKKPTIVELKFDGEYEGLIMNLKMPKIKEYIDVIKIINSLKNVSDENADEGIDRMVDLVMQFAISWNMEQDGLPVPLSREELRTEELAFLQAILGGFTNAFDGVQDKELGKDSGSGETSLISSLPQENL